MYAGRLPQADLVVWVAALLATTVVVALAWRSSRATGPATRAPWALLVPWASLGLTVLVFTVGHAHPLAQYNDETTRGSYDAWGTGWLVLMPGTLVLTVFAAARSLVSALRGGPGRWARTVAWAAASAANAATVAPMAGNFPDA